MLRRRLRSLFHLKTIIICSLLTILIYCEYVTYYVQLKKWPGLNCGYVKATHKILLIADPQILGENDESWIARLDSDRYLHKTFKYAVDHVQPDLIVFLGDLMDEGSIASSEQYVRYYERFRNIFMLDTFPENKTIFIPGDNDIGGENEEVTPTKVNRFNSHFHLEPYIINYDNLQFIKVNSMLQTFPELEITNSTLRVILSHMPVMGINQFFGEQVLAKFKPHIIFSAHDHKSMHFVASKDGLNRDLLETLEKNSEDRPSWRFQLESFVNEIVVPTSSYRMGVSEMAYAVALFDKKSEVLCYYLLWLPSRLLHIYIYFWSAIGIIFFLIGYCVRYCRQRLFRLILLKSSDDNCSNKNLV